MNKKAFYLLLTAAVLWPLLFSVGILHIGGDIIIPFDRHGVEIFCTQWIERNGGEYYPLHYYFYYAIFVVLDIITDDLYTKSSILILSLRCIGCYGMIRLTSLVNDEKTSWSTFSATLFYLFSPAYFNGHIYWAVYAFIPWLFFWVVKIFKQEEMLYIDVVILSIIAFGLCSDLPNPKYIFYAFIVYVTAHWINFNNKSFKSNLKRTFNFPFFLSLGATSYISVPIIMFLYNYNPVNYGVGIKDGYVNDPNANMMDFGWSTADRMFRLFNDGMPLQDPKAYLGNPLFIFSNLFFLSIIIVYMIFKARNFDKLDKLLICLLLVFLLLAVGPNLPLGIGYEYFISNYSVLAFLRTTAGAVFYLTVIYAILISRAIKYFNCTILNSTFIISLFLTSLPLLNGAYFKAFTPVNPYVPKSDYGLTIPKMFFELKDYIDSKRLDSLVYLPRSDPGYISTYWGYTGPTAIYTMLYKFSYVAQNKLAGADFASENVRYVFVDNSILDSGTPSRLDNHYETQVLSGNDFASFSLVSSNDFVPRIYTALPALIDLPKEFGTDFSVFDRFRLIPKELPRTRVEYSKISSTKYRVKIHDITQNFYLVLAQNFSPWWTMYLLPPDSDSYSFANFPKLLGQYKILKHNEQDQATLKEVSEYINNGWISSLGDGAEKSYRHYLGGMRSVSSDQVENYSVDFISKKFFGTIQNNNLNYGFFDQLSGRKFPIPHYSLSDNKNGWFFDVSSIRENYPDNLSVDSNGNISVDLVIEFLPQRLFQYTLLVSMLSILIALTLYILKRFILKF